MATPLMFFIEFTEYLGRTCLVEDRVKNPQQLYMIVNFYKYLQKKIENVVKAPKIRKTIFFEQY